VIAVRRLNQLAPFTAGVFGVSTEAGPVYSIPDSDDPHYTVIGEVDTEMDEILQEQLKTIQDESA
jgi:hypothetical protein